MSSYQSNHVEPLDIQKWVRDLDFVTRRENLGPFSLDDSRKHVLSSIEIMQNVKSILERRESLSRHQTTAPFDLHASTLNTMISSTLHSSGPQLADPENTAKVSPSTPTWYHAIIAAQDGELERAQDGKYRGRVRGQAVELSDTESQPIFQFIHETLPRYQDVQKEIDAQAAMLDDLTHYVKAFVEALREANLLRSVLLENRDLLLSYLGKDAELPVPRRSEPLNRHNEKSPNIEPSKSRVVHDGVRMDMHRHDSSGITDEISKRSRSSTPVSTVGNRIGASSKERLHRMAFLESMVQKVVPWDDVPPLYKEEFGIWRTAASLRTVYSQMRGRSKKSAEANAPSQSPPQTPTGRADNNERRRLQRNRSPTPMSTRLNKIPASEKEIRYRYSFINSQLEKGVTWNEIPALYREEFGIRRTVLALRREYSLDGKRREDTRRSSVTDFAPIRRANNVAGSGSKRHRSPTPVSERKSTITTAEQEKLHRNHFVLSQRRKGMEWSEISAAYKEKFGIWRSARALMGYHKAALDDQEDISSSRFSSVHRPHDGPKLRSKKRKRSPSPAPATYKEVPPTEQEMLHRASFLESHRQAGLSWNEIAELYCEDFGISRPYRALINWYHGNKHKGELDSSVQESASALTPGSDSEDDQPLIRSYEKTQSDCEKGTASNAPSPGLVSVSQEPTSEASSPSPSTPPQANDPASLVASHVDQVQPDLVARASIHEPGCKESTPMTARADEPEASPTVSAQSQHGTNPTSQRTQSAANSIHMTPAGSSQDIETSTNPQSQSTAAPISRIMPESQPSLANHIGQIGPNLAASDADDVKPQGCVFAFNGLPCIDETQGSCDDPIELD